MQLMKVGIQLVKMLPGSRPGCNAIDEGRDPAGENAASPMHSCKERDRETNQTTTHFVPCFDKEWLNILTAFLEIQNKCRQTNK